MKKILYFLTIILSVLVLTSCDKKDDSETTTTALETTTVEETQETTTEVLISLPETAVPYISLYYRTSGNVEHLVGDSYESEWVSATDIVVLHTYATDVSEFTWTHADFQDEFTPLWEAFENSSDSKLGYKVSFYLKDGTYIEKTILKPSDTESYFDYLENYLYDDVNVPRSTWYSHLTDDKMTDDTIITSIKFTCGKNYELIDGEISVSAFVYDSDEYFDENGEYIGDTIYSTVIKNTCEDASLAATVTPTVTSSMGTAISGLTDSSYTTYTKFSEGETVTISASHMSYVYIEYYSVASNVSLIINGNIRTHEGDLFLHQLIKVDGAADSITLKPNEGALEICNIYVYCGDELPDDVQDWSKIDTNDVDMLVFSTHADDEILFLGGVLSIYGGEYDKNVLVVYMTNYWDGDRRREHEKLNGIWEAGIKYYPVNGDFSDLYCSDYAGALKVYDYSSVLSFVTEEIRKYKPSIVVTQDLNGEYGHGAHILLATAVCEAVDNSNDATFEPESYELYGIFDVKKTYLHLYGENTISLDMRTPLSVFDNRTSLEVCADAYLKHVSQQWCWFYVSDEYEYSIADFGLYRTTVGYDTGNDMFENIE